MIVPSIIVYSSVNFGLKETANESQMQSSPQTQKGNESFKKTAITMGWIENNSQSLEHLIDYKNLNIVSPVLGSIDNQFNLQALSYLKEVNTIQKQGKSVWARIIMSTDTKNNVHAFLSNQNKVQEAIKQIHNSAVMNGWKGINIDIENVSREDRGAFSQFIKNLSTELSKTSIILSIDLPPDPSGKDNTQSPFDHKAIGKYCNFIVFMGYDQHWSSDPIPGPITSLSWLKENIQEFIRTGISSDKFILGLPAYTRIWEENQQGKIVKDPAEPIQYVESLVKQDGRKLSWDPVLGEYYTTYNGQNTQYKIWLPTEKSFNIYLKLISQFHLAGSAIWNLDFMNTSYWNQIYKN
jgi:spore germination protein YaaH